MEGNSQCMEVDGAHILDASYGDINTWVFPELSGTTVAIYHYGLQVDIDSLILNSREFHEDNGFFISSNVILFRLIFKITS